MADFLGQCLAKAGYILPTETENVVTHSSLLSSQMGNAVLPVVAGALGRCLAKTDSNP